jgi:hypothetical protein
MNYKNTKCAEKILSLQNDNGVWNHFHALSIPNNKHPLSTEQALRRLYILGYRIDDAPIEKAVSFMCDCLAGKKVMPDIREKLLDWDVFTELMLSTWIRKFTLEDKKANLIAEKWAEIVSSGFINGIYDRKASVKSYYKLYPSSPKGQRLVDFLASFYQVSLIANVLDDKTEQAYFNYVLNNDDGIGYLANNAPLKNLPQDFKSKLSSRYLAAMELLVNYHNVNCKNKIQFVIYWLESQKDSKGEWDMGNSVKDGVYFPLSDSWRQSETRKMDCNHRISMLISKIKLNNFN